MTSMKEEFKKYYKTYSQKYGPNTCIFLEVGKFYEMYDKRSDEFPDGETSMKRATELLNIQLSLKENNELFSGIPVQSLHKYASILTKEQWTVVVVEQVKDKNGKVIERKVTQILSPGTHVEANLNEPSIYIGCLYLKEQSYVVPPQFSVSVADVSTGQCKSFEGTIGGKYDSWNFDSLIHFFQVHPVKELFIVWQGNQFHFPDNSFFKLHLNIPLIHRKEYIEYQSFLKQTILSNAFQNKSLLSIYDALFITQDSNLEASLVSLVSFLNDHFPNVKKILESNTIFVPNEYVFLGNNVLNQLNIIGNNDGVFSYFKKTFTPMGKRDIYDYILNPISDITILNKRVGQLDYVYSIDIEQKKKIERCLKEIADLGRLHHKFSLYSLNAQDILNLEQSYNRILDIAETLTMFPNIESKNILFELKDYLNYFYSQFDIEKAKQSNELLSFLQNEIAPKTFEIETKLQKEFQKAEMFLEKITSEAKLPPNSLSFSGKDSNFFWIDTSKKIASIIQSNVKNLEISVSMKTSSAVINSSYLEQIHMICLNYQTKLAQAVKEELVPICNNFFDKYRHFWNNIESYVSHIDIIFTIANVCKAKGFTRPIYESNSESSGFAIKQLRHPLIEQQNTQIEYVTHDVELNSEGWLLYGMNASGKSSLMKAVGIAVLLAQAGCYVPATSLTLKPFKSVFTRILNQDNIWAGLSSFAVEMLELREILKKANQFSLVLGDELCSGTESVSATSLVASGIVWLSQLKASFIFATHLHGLNDLEIIKKLKNVQIWHLKVHYDVLNDLIVYDRRLERGAGKTYYGLEVAKAMNIPHEFLDLAHTIRKSILNEQHKSSSYNNQIDVYNCEVCHTSISNMLEVHHIIPQKDSVDSILPDGQHMNHIRNLIVLCNKCHDKHHDGSLEIGSVKQTSEGLVRKIHEVEKSPEKQKQNRKSKWSDEEIETIQSYIKKYPNLSPKRIVYDLEKNESIKISERSLQMFKKEE